MRRKSIEELGSLQKVIMEVVWDLGEATVRQVQDKIDKDKILAYTSILSVMQRLEKLGWLKHRTEGQTNIYFPAHTLEHERSRSLKRLKELVFQGNSQLLFQYLVKGEELSEDDLTGLRKIIDDKRKQKKQ